MGRAKMVQLARQIADLTAKLEAAMLRQTPPQKKLELMNPKQSEPERLVQHENFLEWRKAVEGHCERTRGKGFRDTLRKVAKMNMELFY